MTGNENLNEAFRVLRENHGTITGEYDRLEAKVEHQNRVFKAQQDFVGAAACLCEEWNGGVWPSSGDMNHLARLLVALNKEKETP